MRADKILGKLPDPFIFEDGSRVKDVPGWERRRGEILNSAVGLEYGGMPPEPDKIELEALDLHGRGSTESYRVHCGTPQRPFTFCFMVYRPDTAEKTPVVVTGDSMYNTNCSDEVIAEANRRGFSVVKFNRTEFAPDMPDDARCCGINALWPELRFSAISAWAWGYHRVVDALKQLGYIDFGHIAQTGHSRGGKTVLLAGATDRRVRYTNPNGSGTHGCGCYRFVQVEDSGKYGDDHSETLDFMFANIPYWMGDGLRAYIGREAELPHDSHFIKALVAPQCLLETNGYGDIWANPRGSYLSLEAAREVWKLYGKADLCRCWYREGGHGQHMADFCALFDFMEHDLTGCPLPPALSADPYPGLEPLYDWKI
jgi:hypothetical protein